MPHVAESVYVLCALTSLACAGLLGRAYVRSKLRILLWSTICFALLALNNVVLILDLIVYKEINLLPLRDLSSFFAVAVLVIGLIWDGDWLLEGSVQFFSMVYETLNRLHPFFVGSTFVLYLTAALLFLRSYRRTGDRLFLFFAAAFAIFGINRLMFALFDISEQPRTILYLVRLAAFLLILYAIFDKNYGRKGAGKSVK